MQLCGKGILPNKTFTNKMSNKRLIARLDIKGSNLIKGIQLEGLRVVGDPRDAAIEYYKHGIDEILFMDAVASLYKRNNLAEIVKRVSRDVFIPLSVGGGIRSVEDVRVLLHSGADKIAINTAAHNNPQLLKQVATTFGSQCLILSVEAKKKSDGEWEAYTENGREHTGRDVIEWVKECIEYGVGEILITSVDQEGTQNGFDIDLIEKVASVVNVPVIASGGMGAIPDFVDAIVQGHADAVAMASILHYQRIPIQDIRDEAIRKKITVRTYGD